ncbi:ABC transporter substrate-binding protein [soil metagenome]
MSAAGGAKHTLTLAHSADADDVYMWWPLTGKVEPAAPWRVLTPPALDTGAFAFRALPEDIQVLNRRARSVGDLDITAASFAAYPSVAQHYIIADCGSSMGMGFGPKVVGPAGRGVRGAAALRGSSGARIAIPGRETSAFLALSLLMRGVVFEAVEVPFDRVAETVTSGAADFGVVIHEDQLMYARKGLELAVDLGAWWQEQFAAPMPLGANLVRRDLDARFGSGALARVGRLLRQSLDYAHAHRTEALAYAKTFSPLKDDVELARYLDMYVNPFTTTLGAAGQSAVRMLIGKAAANAGVNLGDIDFLPGV